MKNWWLQQVLFEYGLVSQAFRAYQFAARVSCIHNNNKNNNKRNMQIRFNIRNEINRFNEKSVYSPYHVAWMYAIVDYRCYTFDIRIDYMNAASILGEFACDDARKNSPRKQSKFVKIEIILPASLKLFTQFPLHDLLVKRL